MTWTYKDPQGADMYRQYGDFRLQIVSQGAAVSDAHPFYARSCSQAGMR